MEVELGGAVDGPVTEGAEAGEAEGTRGGRVVKVVADEG